MWGLLQVGGGGGRLCGIFYFPWHRHQIEGTNGFYCLIRKTERFTISNVESQVFTPRIILAQPGRWTRAAGVQSVRPTTGLIVQAFYGQKLVNLPQIATEANSTDMISWIYPECRVKSPKESFGGKIVKIAKVWCYSNCIFRYFTAFTWLLDWAASAYYARFFWRNTNMQSIDIAVNIEYPKYIKVGGD